MKESKRCLPAYPLFVKDPYFSIWSSGDILNEIDTSFWTGKTKRTYGIIKVNGKSYCFLGIAPGVEKLKQISIDVSTFRTIYGFASEDFDFEVSFFSPMPISDYEILSVPTCYLEYRISPKKPLNDVSVFLSLHEEWCYYEIEDTEVRGDVFVDEQKEVAYFGLSKQHLFHKTGDRLGAEWGYYYLSAQKCYYHTIHNFNEITHKTNCIETNADDKKYLTAENNYSNVNEVISDKIVVAFDDIVSINYFGEMLRGYYFSNGRTIIDAIDFANREYNRICSVCDDIEKNIETVKQKYSNNYKLILDASYRQVLAAHKLTKDSKGRLLLLSKECGSGGCVATVDVTYPTMPMLLLYRPELVKASIEPIFDFAKMRVWKYPFAPHDAGMYPFCNGQFYGIKNNTDGKYACKVGYQGEEWYQEVLPPYYLYPSNSDFYDYNRQMPIEECADMIIICALYLACSNDEEYIRDKMLLLKQWCDYLVSKGLIPENQLCTDDFLNHMDKNVNLAIKSTVAIGAFAQILDKLGLESANYWSISKEWADEIHSRYEYTNTPLTFDDEKDTYSIKYNMLPSILLNLNLFNRETILKELEVSLKNRQHFGIPLDNRSNVTKTDWMMWLAALSDDKVEQEQIIELIYNYLTECSDRIPFADLYDSKLGTAERFTNRTVQGSMFVLLLKDQLQGNF